MSKTGFLPCFGRFGGSETSKTWFLQVLAGEVAKDRVSDGRPRPSWGCHWRVRLRRVGGESMFTFSPTFCVWCRGRPRSWSGWQNLFISEIKYFNFKIFFILHAKRCGINFSYKKFIKQRSLFVRSVYNNFVLPKTKCIRKNKKLLFYFSTLHGIAPGLVCSVKGVHLFFFKPDVTKCEGEKKKCITFYCDSR